MAQTIKSFSLPPEVLEDMETRRQQMGINRTQLLVTAYTQWCRLVDSGRLTSGPVFVNESGHFTPLEDLKAL
jgi:hypothetical protein